MLLKRMYILLLFGGVFYKFSLGLQGKNLKSLFYILLLSLSQNLQTIHLMLRVLELGTLACFSFIGTFALGPKNFVQLEAIATGILGLPLSS